MAAGIPPNIRPGRMIAQNSLKLTATILLRGFQAMTMLQPDGAMEAPLPLVAEVS